MGILGECRGNYPNRSFPRVNYLRCLILLCSQKTNTVCHVSMCYSWAILYYEDSLALDELGLVEADIGRCFDDPCVGVCCLKVGLNNFNALWVRTIYFVDYRHICHSNI